MTLDIKTGDVLVIGSNEYTIREAAVWPTSSLGTNSFSRLATISASTKRASVDSGTGKRSLATNLTGLSIFPLMPLDAQTREMMSDIASPHTLKQTYVADGDETVQVIVQVDA